MKLALLFLLSLSAFAEESSCRIQKKTNCICSASQLIECGPMGNSTTRGYLKNDTKVSEFIMGLYDSPGNYITIKTSSPKPYSSLETHNFLKAELLKKGISPENVSNYTVKAIKADVKDKIFLDINAKIAVDSETVFDPDDKLVAYERKPVVIQLPGHDIKICVGKIHYLETGVYSLDVACMSNLNGSCPSPTACRDDKKISLENGEVQFKDRSSPNVKLPSSSAGKQ